MVWPPAVKLYRISSVLISLLGTISVIIVAAQHSGAGVWAARHLGGVAAGV